METPKQNRVQPEFDILDLSNSITLDPRLKPANAAYKNKVQKIMDYVNGQSLYSPSRQKPELDDAAFKNILTNLLKADERGKVVAYSRNKNRYSANHAMYGFPHYQFSRYMKIIDALIHAKIVVNKNGYYDKNKKRGMNSRMKLSDQFKATNKLKTFSWEPLNIDYFFISDVGDIHYVQDNNKVKTIKQFPDIVVLLRDDKKHLVKYKFTPKVVKMIQQLNTYNAFISEHSVVYNLGIPESSSEPHFVPSAVDVTDRSKFNEIWIPPKPGKLDVDKTRESLLALCLNDAEKKQMEGFLTLYLSDSLSHTTELRTRDFNVEVLPLSDRYDIAQNNLDWLISNYKEHNTDKANNLILTNINESSSTIQLQQQASKLTPGAITNTIPRKLAFCKKLDCRLYRRFADETFRLHGRFYGADYQGLRKETRPTILIDGQPTVEPDFSAYHTRMLYHLSKIKYTDDPYDLFNRNQILRAAVKALLNMAINAKTPSKARNAFNKKINNIKQRRSHHEENEEMKKELSRSGLTTNELYDIICKAHPVIQKFFGRNKGLKLMYKDSQIASDILMHFTKKKIPCLCMHDSFIVQKPYEAELRQVMIEKYKKYFGYEPVLH